MPESLTPPRISKDSLEKLDGIRTQLHNERDPFLSFWSKYGPKVASGVMSDWDEGT